VTVTWLRDLQLLHVIPDVSRRISSAHLNPAPLLLGPKFCVSTSRLSIPFLLPSQTPPLLLIGSFSMFVAVNSSPAGASSRAREDPGEEDDNSRPSLHFDLDETDSYAGTNIPGDGPLQVLLRNSSTPADNRVAMDIRAVKVLHETSDGYSVTYKVRMSDGFIETVRPPSLLILNPFLPRRQLYPQHSSD